MQDFPTNICPKTHSFIPIFMYLFTHLIKMSQEWNHYNDISNCIDQPQVQSQIATKHMGNAQPLITCALTPLAHTTHVPTITGANFQHNRGPLPGLSGPGDEERDTINEKKLGLPDASPCSANDAENARLETLGQAFPWHST